MATEEQEFLSQTFCVAKKHSTKKQIKPLHLQNRAAHFDNFMPQGEKNAIQQLRVLNATSYFP